MERKFIQFLRKIYHFLKGTPPITITPETIILKDEYIEWLIYANAGMLHKGNLYCIDFVAKHIKSDNPIVEIGSFCGLSTNIISYYFNKYTKRNKIITSDKWEFEGKSKGMLGHSCITHDHYKEFVKNSFKTNVQFFSGFNLPYAIEVFSDEFFELWENQSETKDIFERNITLGGAISFAFIDGNHTYEFARRDFENTDKFLEIGGFILFDDSADNSGFECSNLMSEIVANPNYEVVIKNPNYLFKKVS